MEIVEQARALFLQGSEQLSAGQHASAESLLRQAHALLPQRPSILINLTAALIGQGRFPEAHTLATQACALAPTEAAVFINLGLCLNGIGEPDAALTHFDHALALAPGNLDAQFNRLAALTRLGRSAQALTEIEALSATLADNATLWLARGNALSDMRRLPDALNAYEHAITLQPDLHDALLNRASVLRELRRPAEAEAAYRTTLQSSSEPEKVWLQLAELYHEQQQHEAANSAIDAAALANADADDLLARRLFFRLHACDWSDFDTLWSALHARLRDGNFPADANSLLPLPANAMHQLGCSKAYSRKHYPPRKALAGPAYAHKRLRIGYFSADFFEHATAYLMVRLFEIHDRERFEIHAFSFGRNTGDAMRQRLEQCFEHFHELADCNEAEIAALARSLEIDIAVDLKGFTSHARPGIFALRPAPLQVSYLGYPGSMGANYIDYLIADPVVVPTELRTAYTEKILELPDSYQVNDSERRIAAIVPSRAQCGLPDGAFVFCCFNNHYKITPDVFAVWMRLLTRTPGSVLWLMLGDETVQTRLCLAAQQHGVDSQRLVFASHAPLTDHLARHAHVDLFLDTWYYNAHTTCSDALWCGVPVVTRMGETFAARVAASLLTAAGLPGLITHSAEAYEARAFELAHDPAQRATIRNHLRTHASTLPLFDSARFARNIEAGYLAMHERLSSGLPPEHITITP